MSNNTGDQVAHKLSKSNAGRIDHVQAEVAAKAFLRKSKVTPENLFQKSVDGFKSASRRKILKRLTRETFDVMAKSGHALFWIYKSEPSRPGRRAKDVSSLAYWWSDGEHVVGQCSNYVADRSGWPLAKEGYVVLISTEAMSQVLSSINSLDRAIIRQEVVSGLTHILLGELQCPNPLIVGTSTIKAAGVLGFFTADRRAEERYITVTGWQKGLPSDEAADWEVVRWKPPKDITLLPQKSSWQLMKCSDGGFQVATPSGSEASNDDRAIDSSTVIPRGPKRRLPILTDHAVERIQERLQSCPLLMMNDVVQSRVHLLCVETNTAVYSYLWFEKATSKFFVIVLDRPKNVMVTFIPIDYWANLKETHRYWNNKKLKVSDYLAAISAVDKVNDLLIHPPVSLQQSVYLFLRTFENGNFRTKRIGRIPVSDFDWTEKKCGLLNSILVDGLKKVSSDQFPVTLMWGAKKNLHSASDYKVSMDVFADTPIKIIEQKIWEDFSRRVANADRFPRVES